MVFNAEATPMPRGGARPGAGRKATDHPDQPLLTYSLTLRSSDAGYLNQLGRGNLSLGLRRLVDQHRAHLGVAATEHSAGSRLGSSPLGPQPLDDATSIRGGEKETT
jgi:hypothetical protein